MTANPFIHDVCRQATLSLQQGQRFEVQGAWADADRAYQQAAHLLSGAQSQHDEVRRLTGVAWMNRGNAAQKNALASRATLHKGIRHAVSHYDRAIEVFNKLDYRLDSRLRNHLGAAWLNRGHALLAIEAWDDAAASFTQAISLLRDLGGQEISHVLNLAGAQTNLAHCLLGLQERGLDRSEEGLQQAAEAAREALRILQQSEFDGDSLLEMQLRARRALAMVLGRMLVYAEAAGRPTVELASEAADVIDDGLALARQATPGSLERVRPLALRMFRLGGQLYSVHQPQFLAEFLLENAGQMPAGAAFEGDRGFVDFAREIIVRTLAALEQPFLMLAGTADTERRLETARSLRRAQQTFARLASAFPS